MRGLGDIKRGDTLADQVYAAIHDGIVKHTFAEGEVLTEATLAQQFGVSKTPVRESFLRLREVGLLEPHGGRGVRVVAATAERVRDAYEFRAAMEGVTARLATGRASAEQKKQIRSHALATRTAVANGEMVEFGQLDVEFHSSIWSCCGSDSLRTVAKNAYDRSSAFRAMTATPSGVSIKCAEQHVDIADRMIENDGEAAWAMAYEHVMTVLQNILKTRAEIIANSNGNQRSLHGRGSVNHLEASSRNKETR